MTLPRQVKIVEVGPRDGLQNESQQISTATKLDFIQRLSQTGLSVIEATSFVSPRWIPQLADHQELLQQLKPCSGVSYPVLVPNRQGMENALQAGAQEVSVFTAASEIFCQKNINCSIEESLRRFDPVLNLAQQHNIKVRAYISCALGCPYEGQIDPAKVVQLAQQLYDLGCYEISIGDTIGVSTAKQAQSLLQQLSEALPLSALAIHFHDTYGQALANIYACLEVGVAIIDSAIGGLGGCPYAKGASGNVATEDVVYMLQGLGIKTGIDLNKLVAVSQFISRQLQRESRSKVTLANSSPNN